MILPEKLQHFLSAVLTIPAVSLTAEILSHEFYDQKLVNSSKMEENIKDEKPLGKVYRYRIVSDRINRKAPISWAYLAIFVLFLPGVTSITKFEKIFF